jgi:hypothetical protein
MSLIINNTRGAVLTQLIDESRGHTNFLFPVLFSPFFGTCASHSKRIAFAG